MPKSYLKWLSRESWFADDYPSLAAQVRELLGTSSDAKTELKSQQQTTMLVADTLKTWRRTVLAKWHPDRAGGSHSAFVAVTDAVETLGKLMIERGVSA